MATKKNDHEEAFEWYLDDLLEHGYIERYDREAETFKILDKGYHDRVVHLQAKKNKTEKFALFGDITYTYDYRVVWNEKAQYYFYEIYDPNKPFIFGRPEFIAHIININNEAKVVSYVDVKPHSAAARFGGGKNASYYTFPFIQKIAFLMFKICFNKVIPIHTGKHGHKTCLFAKTFVPTRYMFTTGGTKQRKIPYPKKGLASYIKGKKPMIDKYLQKHFNEQNTLL